MAGHSKWANIKHKKARTDKKRGKEFSKIIRELTVASRLGGPAPEDNPRLRTAMDKAFASNMPKDTVERAIKRGAGDGDEGNLEELNYEGYGPGGIAVFVEAMTDNRNRTVAAVRSTFNKYGGNLGTDGSVAYLFQQQGQISFLPDADFDTVLEAALDAGAEDVVEHDDGSVEVVTLPNGLVSTKTALVEAGHTPIEAEVVMVADNSVTLDVKTAAQALRLLDALEDLDDVQNVFSNGDFPIDAYQN